jgi:ribosomal protein S18 acetylase RimI-like enzyme
MLTYQNAAHAPYPADLIQYALPWVMEAGNPYYTLVLGGAESTLRMLDTWMRRSSSEISISRVQFLICESEFAGGFIALSGGELRKARKSDSIALLNTCGVGDRPALIQRMANLSDLFLPVADDEYYLSKLGLNSQYRGRKLGRVLVERYIEEGRIRGYMRYRLDVQAGNEAAIRSYCSAGFQRCERNESKDGTLAYYSMRYERLRV